MSLRDEVEQEYADRMAELRDMYRLEMDAQSETFAADKKKMQVLENSLQVSRSFPISSTFLVYSSSLSQTRARLNILAAEF